MTTIRGTGRTNATNLLANDAESVDLRLPPEQLKQVPLSAIGPVLLILLKPLEEASTRIVTVHGIELLDNLQGLAELLISNECVTDWGLSGSDTVGAVLDTWNRQDQRADCTALWQMLVSLGRFDLLRKCRQRFLRDAELYWQRCRLRQPEPPGPPLLPTPERRFDVYVSYCENSHEDSAKAAEIVAKLRENEFEVISAEDRLAGTFPLEEYHRLLSCCNRVLVLWSRAYQAEENLRYELNHARSTDPAAARRRVIPVLLDDTPPPGHLAGIKAVRFGSRIYIQQLVRSLRANPTDGER